jgi:transposase-like protein
MGRLARPAEAFSGNGAESPIFATIKSQVIAGFLPKSLDRGWYNRAGSVWRKALPVALGGTARGVDTEGSMARQSANARSIRDWDAIRAAVFGLLEKGATASAVAKEVGVNQGTVRRWRRRWTALCTTSLATPVREGESVGDMLRREAPAVARVILDQAKGGDVRAAALVMKLVGPSVAASEGTDDADAEARAIGLARELDSLPPSVAYEVVELLDSAGQGPAGGDAGPGETARDRSLGSVHLPWTQDDPASDEGADEV